MKRPLEDVLRDMALLAKELKECHGATETKVRLAVYGYEMDYVVDAMETVVSGTTMSNGDDGWWRMGDDGFEVVVGPKE